MASFCDPVMEPCDKLCYTGYTTPLPTPTPDPDPTPTPVDPVNPVIVDPVVDPLIPDPVVPDPDPIIVIPLPPDSSGATVILYDDQYWDKMLEFFPREFWVLAFLARSTLTTVILSILTD